MIDKSKLLGWINRRGVDISRQKLFRAINSGEFDCEAVKTCEWKPKVGELYYYPDYCYAVWSDRQEQYTESVDDIVVINKGEAFKTESDCKRYMNAKGWINDNKGD